MAKVLVVTSGKGGVGKTTTTAALGAALAQSGKEVCVVDFDVGLRNLDLVMGAERRVVYDFVNVTQGNAKLPQALIKDKRLGTLSLLAASQTRDKDALTEKGVARVMRQLRSKFDWVVCDSPAGIERGAQPAIGAVPMELHLVRVVDVFGTGLRGERTGHEAAVEIVGEQGMTNRPRHCEVTCHASCVDGRTQGGHDPTKPVTR